MKKILLFLLSIFPIIFCCCSQDDGNEPKCTEPIGKLSAKVHEDASLEFYSTTFYNPDESTIEISAHETTPFCVWIGSLSFTLEKRMGEQELKRRIAGGARDHGETVYHEMDDDVILGRFDLYEAEPRSMEITALSEGKVEGVFTATYVYDPGPNRYINLPDTLRFKNVAFEAMFFDPKEGN